MLVKATATCVKELLKQGIEEAYIEIWKPMFDLIPIAIHSKKHQECQVADLGLLRNSAGETHLGILGVECEESVFIEQLGCVLNLLLYGRRIKVDLDTVVILSGFASLLYHGQISQKLVCLSDLHLILCYKYYRL